jgi:hypothetical protein
MPSDFFHELGKAAARQLAQNIDAGKLAKLQSDALSTHIAGPMARDAMPTGLGSRSMATGPRYDNNPNGDTHVPNMSPRGQNYDQDPNDDPSTGGQLTAAWCLAQVQKCLEGLSANPQELDSFVEGLQNILEGEGQDEDPDNNGKNGSLTLIHRPNGGNNNGDRRMSRDQVVAKNAGALDAAMRIRIPGMAMDRMPRPSPSVQSARATSFNKRWGDLVGNGRISLSGTGR